MSFGSAWRRIGASHDRLGANAPGWRQIASEIVDAAKTLQLCLEASSIFALVAVGGVAIVKIVDLLLDELH
jgi:hypothetical protein